MKFVVRLKDPDGFSDSVRIAVDSDVAKVAGLDPDEKESVFELRQEKVWDDLAKFVTYQEYITIEFDTDAGTATVVPVRG